MFNFSLSFPELAFALFREQLKLESLANLSILDSTISKDKYLADSIRFTLDQEIDSVNGAFYVKSKNGIRYECLGNAVFACWLLSAGRALYSGELTLYGKLMIESMDKLLWNTTEQRFLRSLEFEVGNSPYEIEYELLKSKLTADEFKLLEGYLNKKISEKKVACIFRNRLSEAATFSGLVPKQAQILDGSLRSKIKKISNVINNYPLSNGFLHINEEACVFSCMTQALLWHGREIELFSYQSLKSKLLDWLYSNKSLMLSERINLAFVLLESLQLEWDDNVVKKIRMDCERDWDSCFNTLDDFSKFQLARIFSIIKNFGTTIPAVVNEYVEKRPEFSASIFDSSGQNSSLYFEKYRVNLLKFNN